MKQVLLICWVLLLTLSPAAAGPSSVSMNIYNDMFTFGFGSNPDDLRSYGAALKMTFPSGGSLELSTIGLTNRYEEANKGRIDEIRLVGRYPLHIAEGKHTRLILTPYAGVVLSGPLGYQGVQNIIHQVLDIEQVDIPYDNDGRITVHPMAGAALSGTLRIMRSDHADFVTRAVLRGHSAPGWEHEIGGDLKVGFIEDRQLSLLGGISYQYRHSSSSSITHQRVSQSDTGWNILLETKAGIIKTLARWNLDNLHGTGSIGITLGEGEDLVGDDQDFRITHSFLIPIIGHNISLRRALTPYLGVTGSLSYYSRSVDGHDQRENFASWLTGVDAELQLQSIPCTLFMALEGGVRHILILDYQKGTSQAEKLLDEHRATAELTGGLRLFQQGEILYQGVSYGLELSGGVQLNDTRGLDGQLQWKGLQELTTWVPFAQIGLTAGFSWDSN